ncbi:MAG: glycogen synthase GlgA [Pseudomonadota bacterium]|uniref:glycogen synthase GlgA n=1 Tax=Thermithiobacillus tepidarius TaxID=929 RepID=UPI00040A80A8|nr:glycogen synthase GlgA [Thermithiobacillus tepidarius]
MTRILFVTSEIMPLSKTGGLGDVSQSLPAALRHLGHDVRVLTPAYGSIAPDFGAGQPVAQLHLPGLTEAARLSVLDAPEGGYPIYLLHYPPYYQRPGGPYQDPQGQDWSDNDQRFALLARVGQELAQGRVANLDWRPEVVHANDWQSALLPYLLVLEERAGASRPGTLFTVHNLAYQGIFPAAAVQRLGLPPADFHLHGTEYYGQFSFMKTGLVYADRISTVSPTYAREIQTPEFGMGLDGLLRERARDLRGILNGIDTRTWNPTRDAQLPARYEAGDLAGKTRCKRALQREMGLPEDADAFLFGVVSRLVSQKGMDLVADALPEMLAGGGQFALLGSGERELEERFQSFAADYPTQVAVRIGYDEGLAHRIEAGLDLFLMPSRFEPSGLNQMYSLAYGTPPLVRRTGGLADTVVDADTQSPAVCAANGFVFDRPTVEDLLAAFRRARQRYRQPEAWRVLQQHGMSQDFSWERAAQEYVKVYEEIRRH